jgi:cell division transport system ATP-binding protein
MGITVPQQTSPPSNPLIHCVNIFKEYGRVRKVFEGAELQVQRGDFLFLAGPAGAGKSTLFRLLAGLESPDRGRIMIEGGDLQRLRRGQKPHLRRRMGIIFDDPMVIARRTVFENVGLPLLVAGKERSHISQKVRRVLTSLGLEHLAGSPCSQLSSSEKQRVCIARAVVNDPVILLLDEPVRTLVKEDAARALKLFETAHVGGATVVFATHDPSIVARVQVSARRLTFIENGKIEERKIGQIVSQSRIS